MNSVLFVRLGIATVLALGALNAAEDDSHPTLAVGSTAPDFSLPGIDGKKHTLARVLAEAKVLAVVFTCNHCPTAQLYESRIKKIADDYRGKSVALVAIKPNDPEAVRLDELGYTDVSDSLEDMKIRAAYRKFNFPYLYDGDTQSRVAGVRPEGDAARVHLRSRAEAALRGPHRRQPARVAGEDARCAERHRRAAGGQAGAGGDTRASSAARRSGSRSRRAALEEIEARSRAEPVTARHGRRRRAEEARARIRRRQSAAGELLGDVVRAVRGGDSGTADNVPHVPRAVTSIL